MTDSLTADLLTRAAEWLQTADALLIGAGAGMSVDSGLPDFRGPEGFWRAYPVFQGKRFEQISNPVWFDRDPGQAWGFFGHRLHLYRDTPPHAGYHLLKRIALSRPRGYFVFTSNVDGHFATAGFDPDRIVECHGSIHHLQCVNACTSDIWPVGEQQVAVDPQTIRAAQPWPHCRHCPGLARPNILMFNDWGWLPQRTEEQFARYQAWLREIAGCRVVAIELGAGVAIPTVRHECERRGRLIRVNPRDTTTPPEALCLPYGALTALELLDRHLPH